MNPFKFYTVFEAADILRLSRDTILKMIKQKKLKAFRVGGEYRIKYQAIEELASKEID